MHIFILLRNKSNVKKIRSSNFDIGKENRPIFHLKKETEKIGLFLFIFNYFLFTNSFSCLPALNTGAFDAGILISSLVCGFLPFLAALFLTSKDPNPTNCTFSPFFNDSLTA